MTNGRSQGQAKSGIAKRRAAAKANGGEHYWKRRREIVRAAADVFRDKGLAATSTEDIANSAGVDRATLYYYIGSKEELFDEVIFDAVAANVKLAETIATESRPADEKLKALIRGLMESYERYYPHLYVFLQEHNPSGTSEAYRAELIDIQRRFDNALIAIIQEGIDSRVFREDLPPRLAAFGIIGMVNWTHRWFRPDAGATATEVAETFSLLALSGLQTAT